MSLVVLSSCQDSVLYNGSVSPDAYPPMQDSRASQQGKPNLNLSQVPDTMELKLQDDRALELFFPNDRYEISSAHRTQINDLEMRVVLPITQRNAIDRRSQVRFLLTLAAKIPGSGAVVKRTLTSDKDFTIQHCSVKNADKSCESLRKPASESTSRDILFGRLNIDGKSIQVIAERDAVMTKKEADLYAWELGRFLMDGDVLGEFSGFDASE